ncbi:MAG: FAD/NAD(P)-binding protein [Desulfobulbaceae bacterium]|nr:FAD/NAD(P)-binding protein [Desulfobulbaceae bacterium]
MKGNNENIYLPYPARIVRIVEENNQIKTFSLTFTDPLRNESFEYSPGQFMMVSIPNYGEAPISIASSPSRPGSLEVSVRKAGALTTAMHAMNEGEILALRGPYGKPFPMKSLEGRDLLFVAGGIGLAPLRSVINFCLDKKKDFGSITLLYGSRSPEDVAFQSDIKCWQEEESMECLLTVDTTGPGWLGNIGVVTTLLGRITPNFARTSALVCGPSLMIRFVLAELSRMGFSDENIITTLERHMKCGVGICRHCYMDNTLVCVDGPVFSLAQLRIMQDTELC